MPAEQLEAPGAPVHDDAQVHRVDVDRGGGHPAQPAVRPHRHLDLEPGTAVGSTPTRQRDDDLRPEIGPELVEDTERAC